MVGMTPAVCLSTATSCKFFKQTGAGDHGSGGCWSGREQGDGSWGPSCSSRTSTISSSAVFGFLDRGIGGSNLILWENSYKRFMGRRLASQHGFQLSCAAEVGVLTGLAGYAKTFSYAPAAFQVQVCMMSQKWCAGGLSKRCQILKVRAAAGAAEDDADQDPLGPGYWDGEKGKQQLNDIEDMKELIAEAENLRRAESSDSFGTGELTPEEIEKQKAERLREELARRAREQAEQRKQAEKMFDLAQRAYGSGVYDKAVELLEAALSNVPSSSNFGGEIQIWLAMAYEANNRHGDCIAIYKRVENSHPNKQIRRQAADLRYILEAPKLKISKDEMVSIPLIERDYDRDSKSWSQKVKEQRRKPMPKSKSKDYLDEWLVWDPPRWERNPYFWVAVTVWLTLVGISLMFQD